MRILIASALLMLASIQQSMSASGDTYSCSHIHSYAIDEQGPTKLEKEKDFTFEWRPTTIFFIGSGKEFDIEKTNTSGFTINYSPPGEGLQKQLNTSQDRFDVSTGILQYTEITDLDIYSSQYICEQIKDSSENEIKGDKSLPERLLDAKYYGLLGTSSIPFDYNSLIGKSCSEMRDTLKNVSTKSLKVLVGSYFGPNNPGDNKIGWGQILVEPTNDCKSKFGNVCSQVEVKTDIPRIITSSENNLVIEYMNAVDGDRIVVDNSSIDTGFVDSVIFYGPKAQQTFGKEKLEQEEILCIEPN